MESAVIQALRRPPCVVAFSGGRDSSAVLAVAVHVARRQGLPEPIPVTRVFADVPETHEGSWQELVIRHLGVTEWVREHIADEMDLVGPLAQPRLHRYGVLWSPVLHGDDFFLRHARGGSVLDGEGGDEVCSPGPHRIAPLVRLIRRRRIPGRRQLRMAAGILAPSPLRGHRARMRGLPAPQSWLKPAALDLVADAYGQHVSAEPLDMRRSIMFVLARRSVTNLLRNRGFFADCNDTLFISPLLQPSVAAAIAAFGGPLGYSNRAEGLAAFCEDLVPEALLQRRTKAEFNATFFNRHSHDFAQRWSGAGIDPELVDAEALRAAWTGPGYNALSAALLQTAWLAEHAK